MQGLLDARSQALCWSAVFFLASAAASSAYLTVSEIFPLEMRALAIAVFYAVGTGVGGVVAPILLGLLIQSGSRARRGVGLDPGRAIDDRWRAALALAFGVDAERKPLEDVAAPMSLNTR